MSVQESEGSSLVFVGPGEGIDDFLAQHKPSLNLSAESWYWVSRPTARRSYTEEEYQTFMIEGGQMWNELIAECERIKAEEPVRGNKSTGKKSQKQLREIEHGSFHLRVAELARRCHVLSGKWLFMPGEMWVDSNWAKVAKAVAGPNGALQGTSCSVAKVSASANKGANYVICAYCEDSYDREAVGEVFDVFVDQLKMSPTSFKTDAFTLLGIYLDNKAQIKASLYTKADFLNPASGSSPKTPKLKREKSVASSPDEEQKPRVDSDKGEGTSRKRTVKEEEEDGAGFDPVSSEDEEDVKPKKRGKK